MLPSKKALTSSDLLPELAKLIQQQNYKKKAFIEGVQIIELKNFTGEDGYFLELARVNFDNTLLALPKFELKQISYSVLTPGSIKAWHVHYNQEDLWFVPPESTMLVGLVDLRKNSTTANQQMRIVLGNHKTQLLMIPRGVAHGVSNIGTTPASMVYLLNQQFDLNDPDERRLPWDHFGKDFWLPQKG